jgi:endonuclease/exonuclease/phosphatase family metal-dependent hydrolase
LVATNKYGKYKLLCRELPLFLGIMLYGVISLSQSINNLTFGTDTTFEVVTWNIEWFPKNGQITVDYVTQIIGALDADILAIQEVDDIGAFENMTTNLVHYEGYLESLWFAGLAYIYKPAVVNINGIYEIYTTSPYWSAFPRSPMVMDLNYKDERIIVINNHFKCCGDGILNLSDPEDEETRRYYASNLLKEYIDSNFPDENVIVLGDLNDDLADNPAHNVFQQILDDDENYMFVDYEIATGANSEWSYPNWPSHLDHILITNELFENFNNTIAEVKTIKIDEYMPGGWDQYESNVSDHRPVALKLNFDEGLGLIGFNSKTDFSNYPNPFETRTTFTFSPNFRNLELIIFNSLGKVIFSQQIQTGKNSIVWDGREFPAGIYFAGLFKNQIQVANRRIVLIK